MAPDHSEPSEELFTLDAKTYLKSLNKTFESGRYSDFTIICDGRQWKVHSLQLCHWSEVRKDDRRSLQGIEASERKIELPKEDHKEAVIQLLRYFYRFKCDPDLHTTGQPSHLVLHFRAAIIADKHMVPELVEHAFDKLCHESKAYWRYDEFAAAIREVYEAEGDEAERFRNTVLQTTERYFQEWTVDAVSHEAFWQAVEETPRFSVELLRKMSTLLAPFHKDNVHRRRFRYPSCKAIFRARVAGRTFTHACGRSLVNGYVLAPDTWMEHTVDP